MRLATVHTGSAGRVGGMYCGDFTVRTATFTQYVPRWQRDAYREVVAMRIARWS